MSSPLVSIISINYNNVRVTCEMLASLRSVTYPNVEVIVVDNASPTEDPQPIADEFPEVKLIRSARNYGFAGGNNLGIQAAKGKYLLFLNNDTEVAPGFLEPMVRMFENNSQIGIASPKIVYHDTDKLLQYAGSTDIHPLTGRGRVIGGQEKDLGQYNTSARTELAHGAAMMVPMEVIRKVGLMPELYFLYYEEHDWCEMIKRAGFSCQYIANATIYHKESVSVGKTSVLKTYYLNRNRLLFMRRNTDGWQFWSGLFFFLLLAVPKNSLKFGMTFQLKHLRALWQGLWWNLRQRNVQENFFIS